jgi:hypothetical protein
MADNTMGLKYHNCPMFNGQVEKFLTWYFKLGSFVHHQGFKQAISMEIDAQMPQQEDFPPDTNPIVAAAMPRQRTKQYTPTWLTA